MKPACNSQFARQVRQIARRPPGAQVPNGNTGQQAPAAGYGSAIALNIWTEQIQVLD
jgi:hypothetical protein